MVPDYVWCWALAQYQRTRAGGRGGAQAALNKKKVAELWLPVPPVEEQDASVASVDFFLGRAAAIERRMRTALRDIERLPEVTMARAFKGRLVATNAELAQQTGERYESAVKAFERVMERAA